jgi:hypothetical protein
MKILTHHRERLLRSSLMAAAGAIFGLATLIISNLAVQYERGQTLAIILFSLNSGATIFGYLLGLPIGSTVSTYLPPMLYWAAMGFFLGLPRKLWIRIIFLAIALIVSLALFLAAEFNFHPA